MKIAIATDHNGVNEKKELIKILNEYEFLDKSPVNNDTDDYPDFAFAVAESVNKKEVDLGVLLCGTGIGMSIAANKVKGIICGHCSTKEQAHLTKEHNHANIIALSYKNKIEDLKQWIYEFLITDFSNEERHVNRVNMIKEYEEKNEY